MAARCQQEGIVPCGSDLNIIFRSFASGDFERLPTELTDLLDGVCLFYEGQMGVSEALLNGKLYCFIC